MKEDRLTFGLSVSNFAPRFINYKETLTNTDYRQTQTTRMERFYIGASVQYRLGSLKAAVKKAVRTIQNTDVKQKESGQQGGGQ